MLSVEMHDAINQRRLYANRDSTSWRGRLGDGVERSWTDEAMADQAAAFFQKGCTQFRLHLEDTILVMPQEPVQPGYTLVTFDCLTGTCYTAHGLGSEQVQALLSLAIAGDDCPEASEHYSTLVDVLAAWPVECRPVP